VPQSFLVSLGVVYLFISLPNRVGAETKTDIASEKILPLGEILSKNDTMGNFYRRQFEGISKALERYGKSLVAAEARLEKDKATLAEDDAYNKKLAEWKKTAKENEKKDQGKQKKGKGKCAPPKPHKFDSLWISDSPDAKAIYPHILRVRNEFNQELKVYLESIEAFVNSRTSIMNKIDSLYKESDKIPIKVEEKKDDAKDKDDNKKKNE